MVDIFGELKGFWYVLEETTELVAIEMKIPRCISRKIKQVCHLKYIYILIFNELTGIDIKFFFI